MLYMTRTRRRPYFPSYTNLSANAIEGELLHVGLPARVGQFPSLNYLASHALPANPLNLHSLGFLTLLIYAQENRLSSWTGIGSALYSAFFNDALGKAIGFKKRNG
jgi:hypothetical protein